MSTLFLDNTIAQQLASLQPILRSERGSLALYTFRGTEQRALMREVGRLREKAFSEAGGGTGKPVDIDTDDLSPDGYNQLIAWDIPRSEIVGGYRYIVCRAELIDHISTHRYFHFSPTFKEHYLPHSIEMGRAFTVRRADAHPLFAMEALWRGLGHVVASSDGVRYLFGKVTIYRHYDAEARRLLMLFLRKFFPPREPLMWARTPFVESSGSDPFTMEFFDENYALLRRLLRRRGEMIPPIISAYMRLSRQMQIFDTVINPHFGHTYETALLLPVDDITTQLRERYVY